MQFFSRQKMIVNSIPFRTLNIYKMAKYSLRVTYTLYHTNALVRWCFGHLTINRHYMFNRKHFCCNYNFSFNKIIVE